MSKDTPEVGDVWKTIEDNKQIILVKEDTLEDVFEGIVNGVLSINEDYKRTWYKKHKLAKVAVYLGKSKANIDDLFKTENEK